MRSFVKMKSSRIGEITIPFTDIGKSRPCREFLTSQICVLTLFANIKCSRKFPNLQYIANMRCLFLRLMFRYGYIYIARSSTRDTGSYRILLMHMLTYLAGRDLYNYVPVFISIHTLCTDSPEPSF